jgi:hypothetical protein
MKKRLSSQEGKMTEFDSDALRSTPMIQPRTSGLAIASLVTGVTGWIFLPIIGMITAIITGHMANKEIKNSNGSVTGKGMAKAGLILGYVQLALMILAVVIIVLLLLTGPSIQEIFNSINTSLQS